MVVVRGAVVYPTLQNLSFLYDLLLSNLYSILSLFPFPPPLSSVSSVIKGFTGQAGPVQCFNYLLSF